MSVLSELIHGEKSWWVNVLWEVPTDASWQRADVPKSDDLEQYRAGI